MRKVRSPEENQGSNQKDENNSLRKKISHFQKLPFRNGSFQNSNYNHPIVEAASIHPGIDAAI